MAGGASRKDELVVLNSTNVFAALGSLKKKKKGDKSSSKSSKGGGVAQDSGEAEKEVFWAPAPLIAKSWADVDDEDDDDYYATTAPPEMGWAGEDSKAAKESELEAEHAEAGELPDFQESESEEEGGDEVDDVDEEHENELEAPLETEPVKKLPEPSPAPKDTERQLSKKELKKKGLEELEAVLAELGYPTNTETSGQDDSSGVTQEKKVENQNGDVDKKENATGESKSAKKKKKKDKSSKEPKESQDQPDGTNGGSAAADENTGTDKGEDASSGDVKERLKKVASMKKKKSSKEMDAAARAAASEAAARNARLAASKKKEKNHYNQQPVR
ncbi:hypothetical protein DVH24_029308 [Malus domestica]|uniref:Uncharacterized protein n=1 Tax=Malus domestica TaxID=3750 RepID=A0A498HYD0_MALDO|nr:hypothetical protein DVH24_029308 [Malus domestica]